MEVAGAIEMGGGDGFSIQEASGRLIFDGRRLKFMPSED